MTGPAGPGAAPEVDAAAATAVENLELRWNPALASVDALTSGALAEVVLFLSIEHNPSLPTCAARAVYDGLAEKPSFYCLLDNAADGCAGDPDLCEPFPQP